MDELDPAQRLQLDALAEEYTRRHGVAVEYLKEEVGPGEEFTNPAARAVISPNGAWVECIDLPMEFSGAAGGPVRHRFHSNPEALELLEKLHKLSEQVSAENTRRFELFVLYTRSGIVDQRHAYVFHLAPRPEPSLSRPREMGRYLPGVLPLFYRCRIDSDLAAEELSMRAGVVFCLSHIGEKNLVVEIPYEGEQIHDLATPQVDPLLQ